MMWGWSGYGYDWVGGAVSVVVMLVLLAALAGLVVWAVTSSPGRRRQGNEPEAILRRRLAAGEITEQEYEHLLGVLHRPC